MIIPKTHILMRLFYVLLVILCAVSSTRSVGQVWGETVYPEMTSPFSRWLNEAPFNSTNSSLGITSYTYPFNPDLSNCPQSRPNGTTLHVTLNTGSEHDLGLHSYSAELRIVVIIGQWINTMPIYLEIYDRTLSIDNTKPEHVLSLDLSAYQNDMDFLMIVRPDPTDQVLQDIDPDRIHFSSVLTVNRSMIPSQSFTGVLQPPVVSGLNETMVHFNWENEDCGFPAYQLQVLRVYNNSWAPLMSEDVLISADVDWSQASTYDFVGPMQGINLTLMEGTGFYVWRVREITDYHPGGFTNPNNWGAWSTHPTGTLPTATANQGSALVRGTSLNVANVFYYDQFDDDRNWNYVRTFSEGTFLGMTSTPHRTSEKLTYGTGLLQVDQEQTRTTENPQLIAGQTVQDLTGRLAVSSLPVPVEGQTTFGYVEDLLDPLEQGTQVVNAYGPSNFDMDDNYLMNDEIGATGNNYFGYYSNTNIAEPEVPSAEDYPFSRLLYHRDGRVKQTSAPGIPFAFDGLGSDPKTPVTYYTGVTTTELARIFGTEMYHPASVSQTLVLDPNGVTSSTYVDKEGRVLATSLIKTDDLTINDDNRVQLGLDSEIEADYQISEPIGGNTPTGDYSTQSMGYVTVDAPNTLVTINYTLDPGSILDGCSGFCAMCDYAIEFFLTNTEDPSVNLIPTGQQYYELPAGFGDLTCDPELEYPEIEILVTLEPGIYELSREITVNNSVPVEGDPIEPNGPSVVFEQPILAQHQDDLENIYETEVLTQISDLITILNDPLQDLEDFFAAVAILDPGFDHETDTTFFLSLELAESGCGGMEFPVNQCPECEATGTVFLEFLKDRYNAAVATYNNLNSASLGQFPNYTITSITPLPQLAYPQSGNASAAFSPDQFDQLIANMLVAGYTCEQLQACWLGVVYMYTQLISQNGTNSITVTEDNLEGLQDALGPGVDIQGGIVTLDLMDMFLDCTGRNMQGWTSEEEGPGPLPTPGNDWNDNTNVGYLTHAFAFMHFDQNELPCTTVVNNAVINGNMPYQSGAQSWHTVVTELYNDGEGNTSEMSVSGWNLYYACVISTGASVPSTTLDVNDPDQLEDYLEGFVDQQTIECEEACEDRRADFEAAISALYPCPGTLCMNESDFICAVDMLIAQCYADCNELEIIYNSNGDPISVGPPEVFNRMFYIEHGQFELQAPEMVAGVPQCDEGFELVDNTFYWPPVFQYLSGLEFVQDANFVLNDAVLALLNDPGHPSVLNWSINADMAHGLFYQPGQDPCTQYRTNIWVSHINPNAVQYFTIADYLQNYPLDQLTINGVYMAALGGGGDETLLDFNYGWNTVDGIEMSTLQDMADALSAGRDPFTDVRGRLTISPDGLIDFVDPVISTSSVLEQPFGYSSVNECVIPFDFSDFDSELLSGHDWSTMPGSCVTPTTYPFSYFADIIEELCVGPVEQNCDYLCINWSPPPYENEPQSPEIPECEDLIQEDYVVQLGIFMTELIQNAQDALEQQYVTTCADPLNISDTLTYSLSRKQHHYTLYYYDRAGNLISTIPPEGVKTQDEVLPLLDVEDWHITPTDHEDYLSRSHRTTYTHNSQGQVLVQHTPNGGTTRMLYDRLGRLRLSQNAKQAVANTYSYTKYDDLGRVIEAGESNLTLNSISVTDLFNSTPYHTAAALLSNNPQFPATGQYITLTSYSTPVAGVMYLDGSLQRHLLNRVSHVYSDEDGISSTFDRIHTYYSYDPHGNVEWMIQDIPFLGRKHVAYEYDLISGRVLKVRYNEGQPDEFYHRYAYDADGRILRAETSVDDVIWDKDGTYSYYPHGPLKRVLVGEDMVQGLDHTYTIQGWLKGINDPLLQGNDAGDDGIGTSSVARDAFGMMLSYYDGDFTRPNSAFFIAPQPGNTNYDYGLYNGNIHAWAFNSQISTPEMLPGGTSPDPSLAFAADDELAFHYRYDVLNRLRRQRSQSLSSAVWADLSPNKWKADYHYDANGNFKPFALGNVALERWDHTGTLMDRIGYHIDDPVFPDRLMSINEPIDGPEADLAENHAYTYDEVGQLKSDTWNSDANLIEWTAYGKVKDVRLANGRTLRFLYDAAGHRILKADIAQYSNGFSDVPQDGDSYTYYVRDAQGNIMATYRRSVREPDPADPVLTDITSLQEQPIYGSSRLGLRLPRGLELISGIWDDGTFELLDPEPVDYYYKPEVYRLHLAALNHNGTVENQIFGYHTSPDDPALISNHMTLYPFGTTDNLYRAETTDGTLLFKTVTSIWNGNESIRVTDLNNNLVYNSDDLRSSARGATLSAEVPGQPNKQYLFTIHNNEPYVNTFDVNLIGNGSIGEFSNPKNTHLDPDWNMNGIRYSNCMAVIDDRTGDDPSILYLERYNSSIASTEIMSLNLETWAQTGDLPLSTSILATYPSKETNDYGEMQVSADGKYLAVTSRVSVPVNAGVYDWGDHVIKLYEITANRTQLMLVNTYQRNGAKISGLDFSPDGNYLYYVYTESGYSDNGPSGHWLHRLDVPGLTTSSTVSRPVWEVRRTKHDQMLYIRKDVKKVRAITNPDDAIVQGVEVWTCPNQTLLPHVALQPLIIYKEDQHLYSRQLDEKNYELTDHLGNVRSVVSDRKLSTFTDVTNADPTDFRAYVVSRSDYYPFGSLLPGRNSSSESYRFAFNRMEKDNEIHGYGNSYDFGARMYDPRVGRWLSLDPLFKKYPMWSAYNFVDGNPIRTSDVDGRDILVLNDREGALWNGHAAVLIGSDATSWTYISKDGAQNGGMKGEARFIIKKFDSLDEFANSPHNFELVKGQYHSTTDGKENPSPLFKLDEDGNKIQRFDRAVLLQTTQQSGYSTDKRSIEAASSVAMEKYCTTQSDCSDVVTAALNVASDTEGQPLVSGESKSIFNYLGPLAGVFKTYNERPNTKMDRIEKMNKVPIKLDRALIPNSTSLKQGERGAK